MWCATHFKSSAHGRLSAMASEVRLLVRGWYKRASGKVGGAYLALYSPATHSSFDCVIANAWLSVKSVGDDSTRIR